MNSTDEQGLKEALKLLNADKTHAFADVLTESVDEALVKVRGESVARVESVTSLTDEEKQKLESTLSVRFGRKMQITYSLNKHLLGGLKVQVGDWKYDASLATYLEQMKQVLTGGING